MKKLLHAESHPLLSATSSELFRAVLSDSTVTAVQSFKDLKQVLAGESFDWLVAEVLLTDAEPSECVDFLLSLNQSPQVAVLTSMPTESALLDKLRGNGIVVMHKSDSFAQIMQTLRRCLDLPIAGSSGREENPLAPSSSAGFNSLSRR